MKECKCVVPTKTVSKHTHMVCTLLAKASVLTQLQQTSPCCPHSWSSPLGRAHQSPSCLPHTAGSSSLRRATGHCQRKGKKRGPIDVRHFSFLPHPWTCGARKLLYLALCEVLQQTKCHYETNRRPQFAPIKQSSAHRKWALAATFYSQYICSTLYCLDNTD